MPPMTCLEGPDRIERAEFLARGLRQGSPRSLGVSDAERVKAALTGRDGTTAQTYVEYLHSLYFFMLRGCVEWAGRWPAFLEKRLGAEAAELATASAFSRWRESASALREAANDEALPLLQRFLAPGKGSGAANDAGAINLEDQFTALVATPVTSFQGLLACLAARQFEEAARLLGKYVGQVRLRHDLLICYLWTYAGAVNRTFGQALAEEGLRLSFQDCSFNGPMWELFGRLAPTDLAAVLAEHLRTHFCGSERDGSVEILEEQDCFRLVCNPCGSGGALRRNKGKRQATDILQNASPSTWGRAGEVPVYCAHCAQNELAAFQRFGHPLWVTEFHPDAERPCGWTIYKQPWLIPARYFERLGAQAHAKAPSARP